MNAIFKKENVYVLVRNIDYGKREQIFSDPSFVVADESKCECNLYGGRVYIYGYGSCIDIDGISIKYFNGSDCSSTDSLSIDIICAYLNQIENLGVDTFLENYKKSLMVLKQELITMSEKYEQELAASEDDNKKKILEKIRAKIRNIVCLIFVLSINLNAGLDNHQYIDAYEEVASTYL